MDNKFFNGFLLVDLKKVFDFVDYDILFNKFCIYGCFYFIMVWFCLYLFGCFQKIQFRGILFEVFLVFVGVLQGSILGLFFFIMYINDLLLELYLDVILIMFVDDIIIFV